MIHLYSLTDASPDKPTLLTIGSFDGVHIGHRALIRDLVSAAHSADMRAAVLTFYPHPSVVLRGRQPALYINRPEEKAALLAELGIDLTITHPFSRKVSRIPAADYVRALRDRLDLRELWAGQDFALGHNREGTIEWLKEHGATEEFGVHVFPPFELDGEVVSSSRVRRALQAGDVEQAARCLGRPFRIPGHVIEGARRGHNPSVPTANLRVWEERAVPATGVYACTVELDGKRFGAAVNVGFRPTFDRTSERPSVEAHLLDFDTDIYGHHITLDFHFRLRAESRFDSVEALKASIHADIARTRALLAERLKR